MLLLLPLTWLLLSLSFFGISTDDDIKRKISKTPLRLARVMTAFKRVPKHHRSRHDDVLHMPAPILFKHMMKTMWYTVTYLSKCTYAFICKFHFEYSFNSTSNIQASIEIYRENRARDEKSENILFLHRLQIAILYIAIINAFTHLCIVIFDFESI